MAHGRRQREEKSLLRTELVMADIYERGALADLLLNPKCGLRTETSLQRLPGCHHAFCLDCPPQIFPDQSWSNSFPCPTCKSPTDFPTGELHSFSKGLERKVDTGIPPPKPRTRSADGDETTQTKKSKERAQERVCPLHPGEPLRFYCNSCRCPVCLHCKATRHKDHSTISLSIKAATAKSMIAKVMDTLCTSLEPNLRRTLQEAEDHKKRVEETKGEIAREMSRRAEHLKRVVDQVCNKAVERLNGETAEVDRLVTTSIHDMQHGLASFLSLSEYVRDKASNGCDYDVVGLLPQLREFFKEAVQEGTEGFELLEGDPAMLSGTTSPVMPEGVLRSFMTDEWKMEVQLSKSSTTKECPFCSFRFPHSSFTCPKCTTGSCKTPSPKNLFGILGKRSGNASNPQPQCRSCSQKYDASLCPNCGFSSSQDALTTLETLIPGYLGHVSQKHQRSEQVVGATQSAPQTGRPRSGRSPSVGPTARAGAEAWNVINTLCGINLQLQDCH